MKRVLLMVFSIILILACIFGLFACVAGVRDVLNINDYKKADAAFARENLETARAGIAQLKENEETYLTGVGTYTDGLSQYTKGLSDYAAGKATLAAGEKTLAEGYAAYEAGKKKLAEGQAIIDANTQAYNEARKSSRRSSRCCPISTSTSSSATAPSQSCPALTARRCGLFPLSVPSRPRWV